MIVPGLGQVVVLPGDNASRSCDCPVVKNNHCVLRSSSRHWRATTSLPSFFFLGPKMVMGASVHPQPPYQDLHVVHFLHSVQFLGSILTSLHTDGDQQVNRLQTAGQSIQRSVRIDTERCVYFCWTAPLCTFIVSIPNKRTHRGVISAG